MVEESVYKDKSTLEVLLGNVKHFNEFENYVITIYDSNILHFVMKDNKILTLSDLRMSRKWQASLGPKKYLNLIEAGLKTEIADEARVSAASANENAYTIADAIVVKSLSQRIMGNFYLRFNKPEKPTRIFGDAESAAFWLMSFR